MKKIIILGGGLWGGLLAASFQKKNPDLDFLLVESGSSFGGNHTWSFHESDLNKAESEFIKPFIAHSWENYHVSFPEYERDVSLPYRSIDSVHFNTVLTDLLPAMKYKLNKRMSLDEAKSVAEIVFDCRGSTYTGECGYQKFVGLKVKLKDKHGLLSPILMDAKVQQIDGFRFMYVLPYDERSLLIEDTRYSSNSSLDHFRIRERILDYMAQHGWELDGIVGEESGILPIPYSYRGPVISDTHLALNNIFHDVTGYSLPDSVRLSLALANSEVSSRAFLEVINEYLESHSSQRRFFCFLNRLMFQVAPDQERYKMLSFFYRKSESQVSKFYSQSLTSIDRLLFFAGKPPVSLTAAAKFFLSNPPFSGRPYYESDI